MFTTWDGNDLHSRPLSARVRKGGGIWKRMRRGSGVCLAKGGSAVINPGRATSPETMAIHHILDEWLSDAPFWVEAAPPILRPQGRLLALAAHRASLEQRF